MKRYFIRKKKGPTDYRTIKDLLKSSKDLTIVDDFDGRSDSYCKYSLTDRGIFVLCEDGDRAMISIPHEEDEIISRIESKLKDLELELIPKS